MILESSIKISGKCPCCNKITKTINGQINDETGIIGLYLMQWTHQNLDHPMNLWLALVANSKDHDVDGKIQFVVQYDFHRNAFMVCDHENHSLRQNIPDIGIALNRIDVIGKKVSKLLFDTLDNIWTNDINYKNAF